MTVVLGVGFSVATVLIPQQCLELHARGLLSAERLQLLQSVLPMELPALLLPLVVCLDFLALVISISNATNLLNCVLAITF